MRLRIMSSIAILKFKGHIMSNQPPRMLDTSLMNPNIASIVTACEQLGLKWQTIGNKINAIYVQSEEPLCFINMTTPFNNSGLKQLVKDKGLLYDFLAADYIIPKTTSYLDPNCKSSCRHHLEIYAQPAIVEDILRRYELPVIVKMNKGTSGQNVFRCQNKQQILDALTIIYDQNNRYYDVIALCQAYVEIKQEWRVIVANQQIAFAYEKITQNATFVGNLSPLHWEGAQAMPVEDADLLDRFAAFIQPIHSKMYLAFVGLDIVMDIKERLWLLEINSSPSFRIYLTHNPDRKDQVIKMYKELLAHKVGLPVD